MATEIPERMARVEQGLTDEREWRREMTVRLERIEGKLDRLSIAVIAGLLGVIAAVLASNWLGYSLS